MGLNAERAMPYFSPPEPLKPFSLRIPESLKAELEEIAGLWTEAQKLAEVPGLVSINDVALRLLRLGVDGVWKEVGGRPTNKHEREQVVEALAVGARKQ